MATETSAWLQKLRDEVARHGKGGQTKVAEQLRHGQHKGFPSAATLSQVLKGAYNGDLKRIQSIVEGALMGKTVECPVAGEISRDRCIQFQTRPFASTNPIRVQLNKDGVCKTCPNRSKQS